MGFELVETVTVGSGGVSSVTFSSIPGDGKDLIIQASLKSSKSGDFDNAFIKMNGVATGYEYYRLFQIGETYSGTDGKQLVGLIPANGSDNNSFSSTKILISDYASNQRPALSTESGVPFGASPAYFSIISGYLADVNPVTSIEVFTSASSFKEHSTITLYKTTTA